MLYQEYFRVKLTSGKSEGSPADPSESNGVIEDLLLEQLLGMMGCRYHDLKLNGGVKELKLLAFRQNTAGWKNWVKAQ